MVFGSLLIFFVFFISCNSKVFRVYGLGVNIEGELLSFDCASQWAIRFFLCPKLGMIISDLKVFKAPFGWGRWCKNLPKIYLVHTCLWNRPKEMLAQKGCTNPLTSNPKPLIVHEQIRQPTHSRMWPQLNPIAISLASFGFGVVEWTSMRILELFKN